MFTYRWVSDGITLGAERTKTSLHSLWASWWLVMCFHGAAKLTAALPPEQNDIVCTLSLPLSPSLLLLLLLLYALALPPSSSLHACWQHKLHSSAVFPHCRSRSCMSSAYLSGMGLLKGNATSRVSVCAHPRSALLSSSLSSSATPPPSPSLPPTTPPRIISVKDSSQERPPPRTHKSLCLLFIFTLQQKAVLRYECAQTSMRNSLLHRGAISSLKLVTLKSNFLWKCLEGFFQVWVAKICI